MERARIWIQTLALAAIGAGILLVGLRPALPAFAAEPPECRLVDSGKLMWEKAGEDVATQAAELIAARGDREHVTVLPYGRMAGGGGGMYSVMCIW
jgi:hypothetical protein